ncbi:MAG: xylulokinase [Rhodobacteraceae bacterium]|jgi:xylulokinase|nr:xylulokinase [Paracoccaceae bacterium]
MTLQIGIDLGTSGIKVVLFEGLARPLAEAKRAVAVSRPRVGWAEQDPDLWVEATFACLDDIAAAVPGHMGAVEGIGLSGQMLAALLLDADLRPVRPAMLWNDQRALAECADLLARVPDIGQRTNGAPDPGITAPKLIWLARHEPDVLARARMLMLTKDYVRLALTGQVATEPTDAGGTQLFDVGRGAWDGALCAAAGWDPAHLPPVVAPWDAAGGLRPALAARWGMRPGLPVAAGAGDNMASTLGAGAARPGDGVLTVGTSGVACLVDAAFHPAPQHAVLTSAHAAPETFLSMGVVMTATAALDWAAALTASTPAAIASDAEALACDPAALVGAPLFLPALTGIRTPLNRPDAQGVLAGLHPGVGRAHLAYATLEGVAFLFADCLAAQQAAGVPAERLAVVGGGTRSALWLRLLATALGRDLALPRNADLSATLGAARLAAAAAGQGARDPALTHTVPVEARVPPDAALAAVLAGRRARWDVLRPDANVAG